MVSLKFAEESGAAGTAEMPPLMPPARCMVDETTAELLLGGNGGGGPNIYNSAVGCLTLRSSCSHLLISGFCLADHVKRAVSELSWEDMLSRRMERSSARAPQHFHPGRLIHLRKTLQDVWR